MSTLPLAQPSESALNVTRCRAIAAHDPREGIRGADYLAEVFLDEEARQSLQDPLTHTLILKKLDAFSPGTYEYFIARTAYLDALVKQALQDKIPQLVFLGAGYDTRPYRFQELLQDTRVFELDSVATQEHKRLLLEQAHIAIPEQLVFAPIDFITDNLSDKLMQASYVGDVKTLFIWEGVTYYLSVQAVNETLQFVRFNSLTGSLICFDYMLPMSELEGRFGAQQARAAMQATYTHEPLQFDLSETQIELFLAKRGYELTEHLSAQEMQARYLTIPGGMAAGQILDLFCLVQGRVKG